MGSSKKYQKHGKSTLQVRSRTTRSKGKVLSDPAENTQQLNDQLRSLGLYAVNTLGDGNCLFRALSDQLHGSPSRHLQLRKEICDWIESHREQYEPFCEDERGLTAHLRCMRERGTYGGHLELVAFAHLTRRNVKVIQPGLVYVIEWETMVDITPDQSSSTVSDAEGSAIDEREKRRLRREQKRAEASTVSDDDNPSLGAAYVAYHDWEHFSSIRNLAGPHAGLPNVVEAPADVVQQPPSPPKKKPVSKVKSKPGIRSTSLPSQDKPTLTTQVRIQEATPLTPCHVPLPVSRSSSPCSSFSEALQAVDLHSSDPQPLHSSLMQPAGLMPSFHARTNRSPKRSFDESSGSSTSEGVAKRTRSSLNVAVYPQSVQDEMDLDGDSTPALSPPGSSVGSTRSSSTASSPLPGTPPAAPSPPPEAEKHESEKPLTRRQRKMLGLPKPRSVLITKRGSAGKIIIPGGRYRKGAGKPALAEKELDEDDDDNGDARAGVAEWRTNGTGRVDVRGFRELKI